MKRMTKRSVLIFVVALGLACITMAASWPKVPSYGGLGGSGAVGGGGQPLALSIHGDGTLHVLYAMPAGNTAISWVAVFAARGGHIVRVR